MVLYLPDGKHVTPLEFGCAVMDISIDMLPRCGKLSFHCIDLWDTNRQSGEAPASFGLFLSLWLNYIYTMSKKYKICPGATVPIR